MSLLTEWMLGIVDYRRTQLELEPIIEYNAMRQAVVDMLPAELQKRRDELLSVQDELSQFTEPVPQPMEHPIISVRDQQLSEDAENSVERDFRQDASDLKRQKSSLFQEANQSADSIEEAKPVRTDETLLLAEVEIVANQPKNEDVEGPAEFKACVVKKPVPTATLEL